jgi:hypothetical protein
MTDGWPFDCEFDKYSDPELLRVVEKELSHLDRDDMVNLGRELATRYEDVIDDYKVRTG